MSQKQDLPPQNCVGPAEPKAAAGPRKPVTKKPLVEWVVQLGPNTDGQISAPELKRPLEGPTDWLIRPKSGEISPFEAGHPPEKNVIRKYITVGAQEHDAPSDLPKISEGYTVDRVYKDAEPEVVNRVTERSVPGKDVIVERLNTEHTTETKVGPKETITIIDKQIVYLEKPCPEDHCHPKPPCKPEPDCHHPKPKPEPEPVCEEKPPVCEEKPHVCEEKPPVCEEKPPVCDDHSSPCKPAVVEAINDCVSTKKDTSVTIDVLHNDKGSHLSITGAQAEHGEVSIVDNKLCYTPNEGFCGKDYISYSVSNGGCASDDACVFVDVTGSQKTDECKDTSNTCGDTVSHGGEHCATSPTDHSCDSTKTDLCKEAETATKCGDHEYSSHLADVSKELFSTNSYQKSAQDQVFAAKDAAEQAKDFVNDLKTSAWSSACYAQQSFANSCAPAAAEEHCAVC